MSTYLDELRSRKNQDEKLKVEEIEEEQDLDDTMAEQAQEIEQKIKEEEQQKED